MGDVIDLAGLSREQLAGLKEQLVFSAAERKILADCVFAEERARIERLKRLMLEKDKLAREKGADGW